MGVYDNMELGKVSHSSVTIGTTMDEELFSKKLIPITPPVSSANWNPGSDNTNDTLIVDLLMVEKRFNIDGVLDTDSTYSATTKKTNLKLLFNAGGVVRVKFNNESFTANFEKLAITRKPSDGTEPVEGEHGYDVKFSLMKGNNI